MGALDLPSVDVSIPDRLYDELGEIQSLLRLGLAEDVADAILGDLDFSRLSALTSDVFGALSGVFPFCVPAIVKQCLGLLEADAAAPVVSFEVMGESLVLDLSGYQGFADVVGWAVRLLFACGLLLSSKSFIFRTGAGGAT
ncbi:MAG: hypothetical protein HFJ75_09210 [Eggerthellaceae bacterium]|nr:hypothetical protein [Eggerthellaceae bacterium]